MSSGKRYLNRSKKYDKISKLPILPIVASSSANEKKVDDITENIITKKLIMGSYNTLKATISNKK